MANPVKLNQTKHHPKNKEVINRYNSLVGLDVQKEQLLSNLKLIIDRTSLAKWEKTHHKGKLTFFNTEFKLSPLILLSGDVGCGKTELASAIGSILSKELNGKTVIAFETPSDLRGSGKVGELSARVTAAFNQLAELKEGQIGILIMDEADDLASSREGDQQHHEDRAGVNALIKELDRLEKSKKQIAVLFITNRSTTMDPAILRRAAVEIKFKRPEEKELNTVINQITEGLAITKKEQEQLVISCLKKEPLFTYSDLYRKVAKQTIIHAWNKDIPFSAELLLETITNTTPSPKFKQ